MNDLEGKAIEPAPRKLDDETLAHMEKVRAVLREKVRPYTDNIRRATRLREGDYVVVNY